MGEEPGSGCDLKPDQSVEVTTWFVCGEKIFPHLVVAVVPFHKWSRKEIAIKMTSHIYPSFDGIWTKLWNGAVDY